MHRKRLVTNLPLRSKDLNFDYRIAFTIMRLRKPQFFYDHRNAKFSPLDRSERQKESKPDNEGIWMFT